MNRTLLRVNRVWIRCPECHKKCAAQEEYYEGDPDWSYVHICEHCDYAIIESEWEVISQRYLRCAYCKKRKPSVTNYIIADDMENPRPLCTTCYDNLYLEVLLKLSQT